MHHGYKVSVYWGQRPSSFELCVEQISLFLQNLRRLAPELTAWKAIDKETGHYIPVSGREALRVLLRQGKVTASVEDRKWDFYNREFLTMNPVIVRDGSVNPEHEQAAMYVVCDLNFELGGLWARNLMDLSLANSIVKPGGINLLIALMSAAVRAFHPEWGFCVTFDRSQEFPKINVNNNGEPTVGWMTYLSTEFGRLPPLPFASHAYPVDKFGHLIVACPFPWSLSQKEGVAKVFAIENALRAAGLLVPLRKR